MKLKKLKLLNFRKFREEEVNFSSDFLVVFGKNGAGKSSLFDAIGYALFGAKSKDFLRGNKSELKSYSAGDKEPCKIALEFELGGIDYRIVRVIEKGTKAFASDFIIETKDEITSSTGEKILEKIDDYIESMLGINRDIFLKTVFTKQKDLEILSNGNEADRKKIIHNILGIDKIEFKKWDIKREINIENTLLKKMNQDVGEVDIEELNKQNKAYIKQLEEQDKLIQNHEKIESEENKKFEKIKQDFEKTEVKREKNIALDRELSNNKTNLENLNKSLGDNKKKQEELLKKQEKFNQNKKIFDDFLELEKKYNNLKEDKLKLDNKIKLDNEIKALEKQILELNNQEKLIYSEYNIDNYKGFEELKSSLNKQKEKINFTQEKLFKEKAKIEVIIKDALDEWKEIGLQIDNINKLSKEGKCPTCLRELGNYADDFIRLLRQKQGEKVSFGKKKREEEKEILKDLKNQEEKILEINKKQEKLEKNDKKLLEIKTNLENFNKNLEKNKIEFEKYKNINFDEKLFLEIEEKYNKLKLEADKLRILEGEIKLLPEVIKNIKQNNENIKLAQNKQKELLENIKKLDYKEGEYLKIKKEKDDFIEKINLIREEKAGLINEKTKIIGEQNLILERIKNYEKLKKDLEEKQKNIDYLNLKFKILGDYILYLLENLKPRIEALASTYFSKITKGKYANISLTNDYQIDIEGKNLKMFSGGEKDLANLCLRLSLSQNMSNLISKKAINFLVLDEILGSQDMERREEILANLKALEEVFSQIILISHVDDIKDYATNLLEVVNISKNESKIEVL